MVLSVHLRDCGSHFRDLLSGNPSLIQIYFSIPTPEYYLNLGNLLFLLCPRVREGEGTLLCRFSAEDVGSFYREWFFGLTDRQVRIRSVRNLDTLYLRTNISVGQIP